MPLPRTDQCASTLASDYNHRMRRSGWLIAVVLLVLTFSQHATGAWPHEAYIWQRQWTPQLFDAVDASQDEFAGFRVLAAETDRGGNLQPFFAADLAGLMQQHAASVTLVLRLDGSLPPPDA